MTDTKDRMTTAAAREHVAGWPWPYRDGHAGRGFKGELLEQRKALMERARQETGWLVDGGDRVEWNGAKLTIRTTGDPMRGATHYFRVTLDNADWRCEGCGEYVEPDHGDDETGRGHTRSEHALDTSCGYPLGHEPVACGPVTRGAWPADYELIELCDGCVPNPAQPQGDTFGGRVKRDGNVAEVAVFVD